MSGGRFNEHSRDMASRNGSPRTHLRVLMGRWPHQDGIHERPSPDEDLIPRLLPATRDVTFHGFVSDLIS